MRYLTYLEEPTLASYRLDHSPRDGLGSVLICWWADVTGASGERYNAMRAIELPEKHLSMNFGAYRGTGVLDEAGSLVFPFREHPALEPYWVEQAPDATVYAGNSFRLALGVGEYAWSDAGGRVEIAARRLGQACTFWVPAQLGFDHPVLSRSHFAKAVGVIEGDPVEGIFMVDCIYGTPGLTFRETEFTTRLHNYWMDWLVEYDDGSYEGGFAWRGMPGTGFAAAHHVVDGVSHARNDARIEVDRTDRGTMRTVTLSLGSEVELAFAQGGSYDWPIHTHGTAVSSSRNRTIVKSWNYSENFPVNWRLVEEYQAAYAALYGRYPSLQQLLSDARVLDGAIAVAKPAAANGRVPVSIPQLTGE